MFLKSKIMPQLQWTYINLTKKKKADTSVLLKHFLSHVLIVIVTFEENDAPFPFVSIIIHN